MTDFGPYHRKLDRVLDRMGGLYLLDDILTRIADGRMQSFTVNNSWVITQVQDFPRARQLHVIALVGDLADGDALHAKVLDYAGEVNASLVSAHGRMGWIDKAHEHGWRLKAKTYLYHREL
jgi:hypothetical protein